MSETRITSDELTALIARALEASRTSPEAALSVAHSLTQAEIDGHTGHGFSRVPSYAAQARAGKVDGFAIPEAKPIRPGAMLVDVCGGFAFPAFDLAISKLPPMARFCGIAMAGFVRSHHFGVAGQAVERLAAQGLVGIVMGNTPKAMASWGGQRPVFGTNPIAFAAPRRSKPAIVIDLALSQVARGKILSAAQKGEAIPEGWALDEHGQPTTDAKAALKGTVLPLGGAKGSALALMVEVLSVALVGANFAFEASSFFDDQGGPPGVGQLLIAIDPGTFARESFLDRVELLAGIIEADEGARLPGDRRIALRAAAERDGVVIDSKLLAQVEALVSG